MAKDKRVRLSSLFLTQYLDNDEYWAHDWAKSLLERPNDLMSEIIKHLDADFGDIVDYACGIVHDKDLIQQGPDTFEAKPPHLHLFIDFKANKRIDLDKLAVSIGVEPQYIEKLNRGRNAKDNVLAYLTHAKESKDKHRYEPKEVMTYNFNYQDYAELHKLDWERGKATKQMQKAKLSKDWLYEALAFGKLSIDEIRPKRDKDGIIDDELYRIYMTDPNRFNQAYQSYIDMIYIPSVIDEINKRGYLPKAVIYVQGEPGVGKTFLIRQVMKSLGIDYFEGSAKNMFDDYGNQIGLILDDVRGNFSFMDGLKLLDPRNTSFLGARYHNQFISSQVIFLTSPYNLMPYMLSLKDSANEDLTQLIRRIDNVVNIRYDLNHNRIYDIMDMVKLIDNRGLTFRQLGYDYDKHLRYWPVLRKSTGMHDAIREIANIVDGILTLPYEYQPPEIRASEIISINQGNKALITSKSKQRALSLTERKKQGLVNFGLNNPFEYQRRKVFLNCKPLAVLSDDKKRVTLYLEYNQTTDKITIPYKIAPNNDLVVTMTRDEFESMPRDCYFNINQKNKPLIYVRFDWQDQRFKKEFFKYGTVEMVDKMPPYNPYA